MQCAILEWSAAVAARALRGAASRMAPCGALLLLALAAEPASADPLVGDVAAAYSTPEAAEFNPANAAFLATSEFFYAPEIYKNETISARYPGFDTSVQDASGLVTPLTKPALVFKLTPRLGLGGFYVPALPVKIQIHKTKVPVILLTTQKQVDIDATGSLNGLGVGMLGYRLSDAFGIGVGVDYVSIDFAADLKPSDGGDKLATVNGTQSMLNVLLGARFDAIAGTLGFGVAVTAMTQQDNVINVDSPLISSAAGDGAGGSAKTGNTNYQTTRFLTGALVGANLTLRSRLRLLLDARYTHVDPAQTAFSLADLKQKTADVHDTLAVRFGGVLHIVDGVNGLLGLRYEPTSVGPGGRGAGSTAGFGTIQLVQVLAGLAPMTPYYLVAAGLQLAFWQKADGKGQSFNRLILEGGVAYTYASLGIDAKGELPGAYLDKRLSIPVALGVRF